MNTETEVEIQLSPGTVVQLNPETVRNKMFSGCFLVITETTSWGYKGYVQALGENGEPGGYAFYRAQPDECEPIGAAVWIIDRNQ